MFLTEIGLVIISVCSFIVGIASAAAMCSDGVNGDDKSWVFMLFTILVLVCGISFKGANYVHDYRKLEEQIMECEKDLPRTHNCVIEATSKQTGTGDESEKEIQNNVSR